MPNATTEPHAAVAIGKLTAVPLDLEAGAVMVGKFVVLFATETRAYPVPLVFTSVPPPVSFGALVKRAK